VNRGAIVGVVVVAAVVVAGVVAVGPGIGLGSGGGGGDGSSGTTETAVETGTVYGDGDGSATTATATASPPPFGFTILSIEECGTTCRDVTVELTNRRSTAAEGVEVRTRMYAGNTTDAADRIWRGTESVGRLDAGASTTSTKRVELSFSDGLAVRDADGWVTILTTVESDGGTITFKERRQVA